MAGRSSGETELTETSSEIKVTLKHTRHQFLKARPQPVWRTSVVRTAEQRQYSPAAANEHKKNNDRS